MNLDKYPIFSVGNRKAYEFLSEGPKGTIKKFVHFEEIGMNLFNLAFGDWDEENQMINDKTRSNNNDRDKVLATVASAVIDFMTYHPDAILSPGRVFRHIPSYRIPPSFLSPSRYFIISHNIEIPKSCTLPCVFTGNPQPHRRFIPSGR